MAFIQPDRQDQPRSAGLNLNLPSNNPFRNRAASPALPSPSSPFDDPPPRPTSRNPFLDPALSTRASLSNIRSASDSMSSLDKRPSLTAEEIFGSLTLEERSGSAAPPRPDATKPPMGRRGPPPAQSGAPGKRENMPPPNHRTTRSQEEAQRARKAQGANETLIDIEPSRSPPRRQERRPEPRPRRNSESSIAPGDKFLTEEERSQRDLRRRERERRQREAGNIGGKDRKPVSRKLDIIDQLDATSIYGTGIFHHDGPFDALNPHRNRNGSRRAPMQAFPEGSLNNTLGGAGPLNARPDHSTFLGQGDDEAYLEWSNKAREGSNPKTQPAVFDPLARGNVLHGDESLGLGTSTFLEGTPAARTAIQKREEERAAEVMNEGLQRKKSLAHRIRNINRGPRDGRPTNPDGIYSRRSPSESGPPSASMGNGERNPFFNDYGNNRGGEEGFSVRRTDANAMSPTSPRGNTLERRTTDDGMGGEQPKSGGGLLGRMKSLKGGRRRQGGQGSTDMGAPPPPGTAV
ncbi:Pal1 cell morphology protein-domain-containing protein [Podospora fimiseda]|uniref:Pal1 cell morphology protein-domain-containing protein n=1 Tax=Podospora fimiseda TaxID=252190 RepID=A0AAN7BUI5_9PEZI|nr:Pal1 cell morphology protein-domain-containing protein [Podospora fimiseda]